MKPLNKYSRAVTQDPTQPAAQAMLHAIGLTKEDFEKPLVGIASTGYEGNPCNMHLNDLAKLVKEGTLNKEVIGLIFNTIGVSDGISMGTPCFGGIGLIFSTLELGELGIFNFPIIWHITTFFSRLVYLPQVEL